MQQGDNGFVVHPAHRTNIPEAISRNSSQTQLPPRLTPLSVGSIHTPSCARACTYAVPETVNTASQWRRATQQKSEIQY